MTRYRHPRVDLLRGARSQPRSGTTSTTVERLLASCGASPDFADALLGDLAEEAARHAEEEGALAARVWYAREAVRSAPHLLWNAIRHGGARGRARAGALLLGVALVPGALLVALTLRDGPPALLVAQSQRGGDGTGIVINSRHPVQLGVRALDAKGKPVRSAVSYRWVAGTRIPVSPTGVVRCIRAGDATVRASAGDVSADLLLHCRPVKKVRAENGINFLVGDPGHDLAFMGIGPDGKAVDLLAGEMRVEDSTVATLVGNRIRPVAPGETWVSVRVGDDESGTRVTVYEPVRTLEGLRADQRFVVAPVRLAPGASIQWPLPMGNFWVSYERTSGARAIPTFSVDGLVMCLPDPALGVDHFDCLVRAPGATIRIAHPGTTRGEIAGTLSLERDKLKS